jgi:phosphoserine aminotransferase
MARVFNFSAGPSVLPEAVLRKAADEMLDYKGSGQSVMEMSHRSKVFGDIVTEAETLLRKLMEIPDNYHVLFLQGGASSQFAMVPLNLLTTSKEADYVHTGQWSKKAIAEAKRYGTVRTVASSEDKTFNYIPELNGDMFNPDAAYAHITYNNTIYGTRYRELPDIGDVPLVADMSSGILAEVMDVRKFGIIYAGAQKNVAPAGLTIVIIREDLVQEAQQQTPTMFRYTTHVHGKSLFNTPPCYNIYIAKLVFEWLIETGGIAEMQKINEKKAALLYDTLDASEMFSTTVEGKHRSLMNVPFISKSDELNALFLEQATDAGFVNLKGHRSVGGMRASIYNAMPVEGVEKLVAFIKTFEETHS